MDVSKLRSVTVTHPQTGQIFFFQRDRINQPWTGNVQAGLWDTKKVQDYVDFMSPCAIVRGYE